MITLIIVLFMKLNSFFILIINLCIASNISGQTVNQVVNFADQQFESGNYAIASKEYNRAFFFGYEKKDILSLQIAHCYSQLNNYELAAAFYDKAYLFSGFDSIKDEAILGKAYCLIIQQKYALAIGELFNFSDFPTMNQQTQCHFLNAIANYGMHQDSIAYTEFTEVVKLTTGNDSIAVALQTEFDHVFKYNKRYNPKKYYIMSAFLPGSGQLAIGAFKEGVNSILLIAGLYFIAYKITGLYAFWDAAIAIFPWLQRYYTGGMDKSKELAQSKIESKRYESYLKILELTSPDSYQ